MLGNFPSVETLRILREKSSLGRDEGTNLSTNSVTVNSRTFRRSSISQKVIILYFCVFISGLSITFGMIIPNCVSFLLKLKSGLKTPTKHL